MDLDREYGYAGWLGVALRRRWAAGEAQGTFAKRLPPAFASSLNHLAHD